MPIQAHVTLHPASGGRAIDVRLLVFPSTLSLGGDTCMHACVYALSGCCSRASSSGKRPLHLAHPYAHTYTCAMHYAQHSSVHLLTVPQAPKTFKSGLGGGRRGWSRVAVMAVDPSHATRHAASHSPPQQPQHTSPTSHRHTCARAQPVLNLGGLQRSRFTFVRGVQRSRFTSQRLGFSAFSAASAPALGVDE